MPDHTGGGRISKHGVTSPPDALSDWNAVEQRYKDKRGLIDGRRLGCQARIEGDVVIDVPPESQVHRQVVRKAADARAIAMDPATRLYYVEVAEPDMHEPSGDFERLGRRCATKWEIDRDRGRAGCAAQAATGPARGQMGGDGGAAQGPRGRAARLLDIWPGFFEGPACTGWPSIWARPPSPRI
jgi:hypothetical protein